MKRILITIPHYYKYDPSVFYGSGSEKRDSRIRCLRKMLSSIRENFGLPHAYSHQARDVHSKRIYIQYEPADTDNIYDIDVVVCTDGSNHLLDELNLPQGYFQKRDFRLDNPRYLGFMCYKVMAENQGKYDYYAYMEDDLVIHDLFFFQKLQWFNSLFPMDCLLQPYRYMRNLSPFAKEYIDSELDICIYDFYDYGGGNDKLIADYLGNSLEFIRAANPHAGCFFVNAKQFEKMLERVDFFEQTDIFMSPLESAASFKIMQNFKIYHPQYEKASFLEIEHIGKALTPVPDRRYNRRAFAKVGFEFS